MILTRLTRWALRAAARRWPADQREELYREWQAEDAHLESRPGTAGQRLGFAFSLLTSPPVRDAAGVPRGWAEARTGLSPAAALIIAALFGLGVVQFAGSLLFPMLDLLGIENHDWIWPGGQVIINGVVLALWCAPVGWWLGRRLPMARDGRLGTAGPAMLAPFTALPALLVPPSGGEGPLIPSLITALAVGTWTVLTVLLGRAVAAPSRRSGTTLLVLAGVPVIAVTAAVAATIPVLIERGTVAARAALLLGDPELILRADEYGLVPYTGGYVWQLIAYGWFAVLYGRRAAAAPDRPIRLTETETETPAAGPRPTTSPVLLGAGLTAVLAGVLTWAYTVTILTPAMPVMASRAPMPGGDGEIYLWVAELRWTAILLAALGMLVATADRRSAPRAAALLAAGLLGTESVLLISGLIVTGDTEAGPLAGGAGLRVALLVAAAVIAASWALAGRAPAPATAARVRVTAVAIAASALGPFLFMQSTPGENHEFMPLGLPVTTAVIAVGLVLLGTVTGAATSRTRLHPVVITLLVVVPAGAVAGLSVLLGNGSDDSAAGLGMMLGLPLAVVVTALLRRHRPRRRGRTALIWTLLTVAAVPATVAVIYLAILLSFVPTILFQIDGTGYPADGISVVPGTVLMLLPAAVWVAARAGGTPPVAAVPGPDRPEPDPSGPGPIPDPPATVPVRTGA
ncbi:hypothetical protein [Actinoplanes sp. G11-F43]|uniref:hypothetical protein n=1 Tax=Actinoplanes sp. G11-F43 TaxID=3424130 RepID=UPI003D331950